jgi:hypothetical protein
MAKKTKRQTRKGAPRLTNIPSAQSTPRSTDFNPDYSHVVKDLRRIGILAGTFIAVLVILSFIVK